MFGLLSNEKKMRASFFTARWFGIGTIGAHGTLLVIDHHVADLNVIARVLDGHAHGYRAHVYLNRRQYEQGRRFRRRRTMMGPNGIASKPGSLKSAKRKKFDFW